MFAKKSFYLNKLAESFRKEEHRSHSPQSSQSDGWKYEDHEEQEEEHLPHNPQILDGPGRQLMSIDVNGNQI